MDLDALLDRRPALALVDELAHSNVPGSRHPKRYQDIEELLDARIDVYTTVNIQHLESLNDLVRQITRVTVRETVPNRVLERSSDVVLIDLPGVHSLVPRSEDERVTHDVLMGTMPGTPKPDAILLILDATSLRRHLVLAAPVLALGVTTLVVLNMADELGRRGARPDPRPGRGGM